MATSSSSTFRIRSFRAQDEAAVVDLWQRCNLVVPHNDPNKDIRRKQVEDPDWLLVGIHQDEIIATCMVGYDGHRGWINYLAVHPDHQRCGYGSIMMEHAERLLKGAGCPKINVQIRAVNEEVIAFYQHCGFQKDPIINMGKRLISDE